MRARAVRTGVWALSGLIVLGTVFALVDAIVLPDQIEGVVIGPGVYFRPSASWADLHFSTNQAFLTEVVVSSAAVTFDGVSVNLEKTPRALPRADITITTWAPTADHGSQALQFAATSVANTEVWFNVTGLRADAFYQVYVDGVLQTMSFDLGRFSFAWSDWSFARTLDIVAYIDSAPPVSEAGGNRTALVNETLAFDGSSSRDDTIITRYRWDFGDGTSVEGVNAEHFYSQPGDYLASLTVWDVMGHSSSDTVLVQVTAPSQPPAPDSVPPAQVTDLRPVEWGADYAVLEWTTPGDDGNDGLAATYDARITQAGPFNESNFADAQSLPTGVPRAAGSTERLNITGLAPSTRYWFALRSSDEVPNWSPISNVVELLTLSTGVQVPSISSVSYEPSDAELEIVFSDSMNQSSVEQALVISPDVLYDVEWASDAHLLIRIQTPLSANSTYVLAIQPHAADSSGTPLARSFTFRFAGIARPPNPFILPPGISVVFVIVMLAGLAGLTEGLVLVSVLFARNRKKMRRLQDVVAAQMIRTLKMRERIQRLGDDTLLRLAARPMRRK